MLPRGVPLTLTFLAFPVNVDETVPAGVPTTETLPAVPVKVGAVAVALVMPVAIVFDVVDTAVGVFAVNVPRSVTTVTFDVVKAQGVNVSVNVFDVELYEASNLDGV